MKPDDNYVYLLPNVDNTHFKIGVSVNPGKRAAFVAPETDWAKAKVLRAESRRHAFQIEKTLHFLFLAYRAEQAVPKGEGYTEWFQFEAYQECLDFVSNNRAMLRYLDLMDGGAFKPPPPPVAEPIEFNREIRQEQANKRQEWANKGIRREQPTTDAKDLERYRESVSSNNEIIFSGIREMIVNGSTHIYRTEGQVLILSEAATEVALVADSDQALLPALCRHTHHVCPIFSMRSFAEEAGICRSLHLLTNEFMNLVEGYDCDKGWGLSCCWFPFATEIHQLIAALPAACPVVRDSFYNIPRPWRTEEWCRIVTKANIPWLFPTRKTIPVGAKERLT
jgi:hypothetical protein